MFIVDSFMDKICKHKIYLELTISEFLKFLLTENIKLF